MDSKLQQYSAVTCQLERQLGKMEYELRNMQQELQIVQNERLQVEQQRNKLKVSGGPQFTCPPCPPRTGQSIEQQLRELREQYTRLQDDYKSKVVEVAGLRRETDKQKEALEVAISAKAAAEAAAKSCQEKLRALEIECRKTSGSKEQMIEQEQQLNIAKQRFREAQDELDEMRTLVQDQASQMEEYRNKYLAAQQQVEEQRRQIDILEADNSRMSEEMNLVAQRVKAQLQEKLQELTPLPELLKATQMKLQEAQQLRAVCERNCEDLMRELQEAKEREEKLQREWEEQQNNNMAGMGEIANLQAQIEELEKKNEELQTEICEMKATYAALEEKNDQNEKRLEEKIHEVTQLSSQLVTVREESARQVARVKERSETVRRSLQNQISDLERMLALSRATARAAQKERDEIRQRMQCQINSLNENFQQAQMRITTLQSNVNYLKTSYSNILGTDESPGMTDGDSCFGDTCNCQF